MATNKRPLGSASGANPGPDRRALPGQDAPRGTTSEVEPELRGKPARGSRMSGDT